MNVIETTGLTKIYKDITAVDHVDFSVREGECMALLGVNGAGKTTTIKMLTCLTQPTSGTATILGLDIIKESQKIKEKINISPQESAIAPNLTVRENLEFICGIYGFDRQKARQKTDEVLQTCALQNIEKKKAKLLSGGYERRLSIAMALITEPQILFLDEPTLGLDILARRSLWNEIKSLKGKATLILTTHYLEEAEAISDRVTIMSHGKTVASGTVDQLKTQSKKDSFEDAFIALCGEGIENENE